MIRKKIDSHRAEIESLDEKIRDLEERADRVVRILGPRHERNHYAESVADLWALRRRRA